MNIKINIKVNGINRTLDPKTDRVRKRDRDRMRVNIKTL